MQRLTTIERAFELARSGNCKSVQEIRLRLKAEGYSGVADHLQGVSIRRQLNALILGLD